MQCAYFDRGVCRSCTLMGQPYATQLAGKHALVAELLAPHRHVQWEDPVASPESGYRNKAKMVAGGTVDAPSLGILGPDGRGIDLTECGITAPGIRAAFDALLRFISLARLTPYDVPARSGELKHVLVTESPDGELLVRFVLRSTEALARIRKHLPSLLAELPAVRVVSVNLLPEHKAVVEGEREIVLTEQGTMPFRMAGMTLHVRPQGFFQTNTAIAAALYARAAEWTSGIDARTAWDLYCGVGGFALSIARGRESVVGVEVSEEAVAAAIRSASDAGLPNVTFRAGDATRFAIESGEAAELVVVNPPRRGIGADLATWLEGSSARHVLYSSCNAASLARDLEAMPSFTATRAQVFDMFPQTTHAEVLVLLSR